MEKFKLTFFEKFKKAVTGVWNDFFTKELPENPSKTLVQKVDAIIEISKAMTKTTKINKREGLAKAKHAQDCLLYIKAYQQRAIEVVTEAIDSIENKKLLKTHIDNVNSVKDLKKKKILKDTLYKSSGMVNAETIGQEKKENITIHEKIFEFMYDFNFEGQKIFRVEEQLMEELLLTEFSNIDDSFFILPYNTICIHVPYNKHLTVREKTTEWIFLTQWIEESCKYIEILCVSDSDNIDYGEFTLCGGDIIKQILQQTKEKWESELAKREMRELFTFISSVLLYINSSEVDMKVCQPYVGNRNTDSALQICKLGGSIKLDKRIRYIRDGDIDHEIREFHVVKWTVRGHFRQQRIGQGRLDKKLLWIRPFIKGKERLNEEINAKPTMYKMTHVE